MADWKRYMSNHFGSCQLLSYAKDHCRNREVRIYLIPGEVDSVGVTDGVDAWIAPVSASIMSVNVQRLIEDLQAGKPLPKPVPPTNGTSGRVRLLPPIPVRQRVRVTVRERVDG